MAISKDDFNILDPKLKTKEWALRLITFFCYNRFRLTWDKDVRYLRSWQNTQYDLKEFRRPYKHILAQRHGGDLTDEEAEKKIHLDFTRLGLFELTKNILGGEIDKDKINIDADCFDPSILAKKEQEFDLLKNKKVIQATIDKMYGKIGIPTQYQIGKQGEFDSNMNQFDSMGLNPDNAEDIEFFSESFYRHNLETYATDFINEINNINQLSEIQKQHINDLLALKCMAMQTYYNTSNGLPTTKYIYPENVFLTGVVTRNDANDAIAKSWEQTMSISDFLRMIADEKFTEQDYNDLMQVCYQSGISLPMINTFPNGIDFMCGVNGVPRVGYCGWSDFFRFTINVGYIEWKTTDRNEVGRYFQKTMKAYYVNNLSVPYKIYQFGYLNVQAREGYESEVSLFSIQTYKIEGASMLEMCIPYFKVIFASWIKFTYFLAIAKPSGWAHDMNSLRRVASEIINDGGTQNDVNSLLEMFRASPDFFYNNGNEESEKIIGGNGYPFTKVINGLDPTAKEFLTTIEFCKQQIMEETGLNAARSGQSPPTDQPNRTTQILTRQSDNATEYINSAIANVYGGSGYRIFAIIQTIAEFNLFGTEQLNKIFGDRYLDAVKFMKKIPLTYFGITVRRFLREREREEIRQLTMQAVVNKEIPGEMAILINDIDDYKKAAAVLFYYKERTRKQQEQAIAQQQQAQLQAQKQQIDGKLQLQQLVNDGALAKQKEVNVGLILVEQAQAKSKMEQQGQRIEGQKEITDQKHVDSLEKQTHEKGLEATLNLLSTDTKPNEPAPAK